MKLQQSFVPIDKSLHLIKSFNCGKSSMNEFLSRFAIKHAQLGLSKTFVLTVDDPMLDKLPIAAYYTLGISTVYRQDLPVSTSLPRYPMPVALLARLAIDNNFQRRNLGTKTLIYALRHAVKLCDYGLPAVGLVLDVLDEDALKFYQKFDFFKPLTNDPMRLFVSMESLRHI
ncbi:GNAT family N-acetyltransferase [Wohlfahrtiimonas chitiniclastica]|uniref:GNAT family N-acetyltransferase n=1 Tax=Wohlfahrtiimonas chitiniclastica TaxID=400946 RepID=UPI000B996C5F|nr:GNAT family N-acetyltransferase [Wohlfahrtiimonas chitiniclastica]OYQ77512.1 GNAT family N-acetyltransferase [Wohlfahrtiimonas chitiniclastica]